ncbi:MAG: hypothetical protein AAFZ52_03355 [Bacteroidota bacterium]
MKMLKILLLGLCFGLGSLPLLAQNVGNLKERTPLQLTGGLRAGMQYYDVAGIPGRAAPWQFNASGRLNLTVMEHFNIPFSFALGRQRPNLRFPVYRQFGLSPRYKWLTVHAGHRNLSFGRYSLNNHTFLGGGLELNPGKLRVAAMYGRLRQGLRESEENIDLFFRQPLYNRFAWGGKIGWGTAASHLDLTYFRAEDRDTNVDLPATPGLPAPAENLVLGLNWRQRIGKRVNAYAEVAASAYNRNRNGGEVDPDEVPATELLDRIFPVRYSGQSGLAGRAGFNYAHRGFRIGADYERIDPGYESMGTYFLNGDWENVRGNLGFGLFKNQLRLQGSLGVQRNNLNGQRAETNRRLIGSGFANLQLGKRSNLGLNYSNFTQDNRPNAQIIFNDTLRIASTTENLGGSWSWSGEGGEGRTTGTLTLTANAQRTNNDNPLSEGFDDLATFFGSANYQLRLGNQTTSFNLGGNFTRVDLTAQETTGYGATVGWQQQFADKKIRLQLSNTFNRNLVNGAADGFSNALRLNVGWAVSKLHSLNITSGWVERNSDRGFGFREQRATLGYGLTLPTLKVGKGGTAAGAK